LTAPADMKQLITRYDSEWRARLMAIARTIPATAAPAYVYAVNAVKILPPVRPTVQLNAGGNYVEHEQGIATTRRAPAVRLLRAAALQLQRARAEDALRPRHRPRYRSPASGSASRVIRATTRICF
jgi:hypothetical protein